MFLNIFVILLLVCFCILLYNLPTIVECTPPMSPVFSLAELGRCVRPNPELSQLYSHSLKHMTVTMFLMLLGILFVISWICEFTQINAATAVSTHENRHTSVVAAVGFFIKFAAMLNPNFANYVSPSFHFFWIIFSIFVFFLDISDKFVINLVAQTCFTFFLLFIARICDWEFNNTLMVIWGLLVFNLYCLLVSIFIFLYVCANYGSEPIVGCNWWCLDDFDGSVISAFFTINEIINILAVIYVVYHYDQNLDSPDYFFKNNNFDVISIGIYYLFVRLANIYTLWNVFNNSAVTLTAYAFIFFCLTCLFLYFLSSKPLSYHLFCGANLYIALYVVFSAVIMIFMLLVLLNSGYVDNDMYSLYTINLNYLYIISGCLIAICLFIIAVFSNDVLDVEFNNLAPSCLINIGCIAWLHYTEFILVFFISLIWLFILQATFLEPLWYFFFCLWLAIIFVQTSIFSWGVNSEHHDPSRFRIDFLYRYSQIPPNLYAIERMFFLVIIALIALLFILYIWGTWLSFLRAIFHVIIAILSTYT